MSKKRTDPLRRKSQEYAYSSLQMHEAVARNAGLSGTDHKYLGFLIEKGQMTAGELAALTGLTTGAVTGLIDRFEKKELVQRVLSPDDRRKVFIEPHTENIMALLTPLYKSFRARSEKMMSSFTDEEMAVIESYFTQATAIMNDITHQLNSK